MSDNEENQPSSSSKSNPPKNKNNEDQQKEEQDPKIAHFKMLLAKNPKHVVARQKLAEYLLSIKDYKECMKQSRFTLAVDDTNIRCYIYLAACHLYYGEEQKARDYLAEAKSWDREDQYRYALAEVKDWDCGVLFHVSQDQLPEEYRLKNSYKKEKKRPTYEDKMKGLYAKANMFC